MRTKSMHVQDNVLYMGEYSLVDLAKEYGTPLYVYDEVGINDKIEKFKNNFSAFAIFLTKATILMLASILLL